MYTNGKMLKRILKYTSHYSFIMVLALICALLYVSAMLFAPWVIGNYGINMFNDKAQFNMNTPIWLQQKLKKYDIRKSE